MADDELRVDPVSGDVASFAAVLVRLRAAAGLSQHGLARAAGIDPTNLNRIERGRQGPPRQATVLRIIRGLGLTLADAGAQQLLTLAGNTSMPRAGGSAGLAETPAEYAATLEPTLRELRATLFRALDLVTTLEAVTGNVSVPGSPEPPIRN